jgi:hypothetical protein
MSQVWFFVNMEMDHDVLNFREYYQRERVSGFYSGLGHAIWTAIVLLGSMTFWALRIHHIALWELAFIPVFIVVFNFGEYALHRWPLHRPFKGIYEIFRIHTLEHHKYFTDDNIEFSSFRDFHMVLFPPWAPPLIAVSTSLFGIYVITPLISKNVAELFVIISCGSMFLYEVMHLCHHLRDDHPILNISFMRKMRAHHRVHHHLGSMSRYNFNVCFPLFDFVFRTTRK